MFSSLYFEQQQQQQSSKDIQFVFTIGCFDLLHRGHVRLFTNMRKLGQYLVVGVHNDESIMKLKKRVPMDNTDARIANVSKYADYVYVIGGTDPTPFIHAAIKEITSIAGNNNASMFVRGDDMLGFPGRELVSQYMPITFLPYTAGVSSTMIRKQRFLDDPNLQHEPRFKCVATSVES